MNEIMVELNGIKGIPLAKWINRGMSIEEKELTGRGFSVERGRAEPRKMFDQYLERTSCEGTSC